MLKLGEVFFNQVATANERVNGIRTAWHRTGLGRKPHFMRLFPNSSYYIVVVVFFRLFILAKWTYYSINVALASNGPKWKLIHWFKHGVDAHFPDAVIRLRRFRQQQTFMSNLVFHIAKYSKWFECMISSLPAVWPSKMCMQL